MRAARNSSRSIFALRSQSTSPPETEEAALSADDLKELVVRYIVILRHIAELVSLRELFRSDLPESSDEEDGELLYVEHIVLYSAGYREVLADYPVLEFRPENSGHIEQVDADLCRDPLLCQGDAWAVLDLRAV